MLLHENQDPKGGLLRGNSQRRSLGTRGSQMGRHLETEDLLFNVVQVSLLIPLGSLNVSGLGGHPSAFRL